MKARKATLGVLGVAALVLAFVGGQRAASQDFEVPTAEPILWREYVYLTFPTGLHYYTNPRIGTEVFYITHVVSEWDVWLYHPPELGPPTEGLIYHHNADTGTVFGSAERLSHPIPFQTTSRANALHPFVLIGYYSTETPTIEALEPD